MHHERGPFDITACFEANELWGTGDNANGQLGVDDRVHRSSPVQVPGSIWENVAVGLCTGYGIRNDNTLWAWGRNTCGQLGQLHRTHRSSPVQVPGTDWLKVSAGNQYAMALKTDGTLWSWGDGGSGQLGTGGVSDVSSPIQVSGTDWCAVSTSGLNSAALKTDSTLWVWGQNNYGQLGINNGVINQQNSPVQVPGSDWCAISAGSITAAIKTDNTLWLWGNNSSGALGQNNRVHRSSPVQVPGTDWCAVETGLNHVLALRTDNTLWAWGQGNDGKLGISALSARSSPVQVPGTDWCKIFPITNGNSSFGQKTDGTLWGWGTNLAGVLGIGTTTNRSSPTQIPGTGWKKLSSSLTNTFLIKENIVVNGTYDGNDLSNVWANDSDYIQITPSTDAEFNDELYARDFRFCMGQKSKIIEANVITRIKSTSASGSLYGGTSNGWYKIQLFDGNGDIDSDIGDKSSSGWANSWNDRFAKISNPSITPSQAMSNTFGVRLGALSTGTPVPIMCVDSVHISLTTENSANAVSQGNQIWQWNDIEDVL